MRPCLFLWVLIGLDASLWIPMGLYGPYIFLFVPMESNGFYWGFIGLYALLWILICFMGTYSIVRINCITAVFKQIFTFLPQITF